MTQPRLERFKDLIIGDYELDNEFKRLVALTCLLIAAVIGFGSFTSGNWIGKNIISLRPDLQSGLFAIFLIGPLYIRGITPWTGLNLFSVLSMALNWSITAYLANLVVADNSMITNILPISVEAVLVGAILLGWLGMRPVAGLAWVVFFLLGALNVSAASDAMGLWGFAFLIAAFFGVLLQADLNPKHLFAEIQMEFSGTMRESQKAVSPGWLTTNDGQSKHHENRVLVGGTSCEPIRMSKPDDSQSSHSPADAPRSRTYARGD